MHLLRHLFAHGLQLRLGLRLQRQGFALFGAAHSAAPQRHVQLHADHGIQAGVAGAAKVAAAVQALLPGLRHQVQRGRSCQAVLAHFGAGAVHGQGLQADVGVGGAGVLLPGGQGAQGGQGGGCAGLARGICRRRSAGSGQLHQQIGAGKAGAVGQQAALHVQIALRRQLLGAQRGQPGARFVGVGDGHAAQFVAVLRLGGGALHRLQLQRQHGQRFLRQRHVHVALGGAQQQRLLRCLPLQFGLVGLHAQLLLLRAPLWAVQGLAGLQRPARGGAAVHRGAEVHAVRCAQPRRGKLRAAHLGVAGARAGAGGQRHVRAPQGGGLVAQWLGAGVRGARHGVAAVVLLGGLPGLQQVGGGPGSRRAQGAAAGQGQQRQPYSGARFQWHGGHGLAYLQRAKKDCSAYARRAAWRAQQGHIRQRPVRCRRPPQRR